MNAKNFKCKPENDFDLTENFQCKKTGKIDKSKMEKLFRR